MSELRITVEIVRKAYEKVGMEPATNCYIGTTSNWRDCGCPQTAMYLVHHSSDRDDPHLSASVARWASKNYGIEYADAFRSRFDCTTDEAGERRLKERLHGWRVDRTISQARVNQGVEDGRACRAEFIDRPKSTAENATV